DGERVGAAHGNRFAVGRNGLEDVCLVGAFDAIRFLLSDQVPYAQVPLLVRRGDGFSPGVDEFEAVDVIVVALQTLAQPAGRGIPEVEIGAAGGDNGLAVGRDGRLVHMLRMGRSW